MPSRLCRKPLVAKSRAISGTHDRLRQDPDLLQGGAQSLANPSHQKTIFVVDRRDLDQQTTSSFLSYAANDVIDIDETDNTHELVKRLGGNDKRVVVTTIQKITTMMRKFEEGKYQRDAGKIKDLRVAFVVDECHRAVTPQTQRTSRLTSKLSLVRLYRNSDL